MPRRSAAALAAEASKTDDVQEAPDVEFPAALLVPLGADWHECPIGRVVNALVVLRRESKMLSHDDRETLLPLCDFLLAQSGATFDSLTEAAA